MSEEMTKKLEGLSNYNYRQKYESLNKEAGDFVLKIREYVEELIAKNILKKYDNNCEDYPEERYVFNVLPKKVEDDDEFREVKMPKDILKATRISDCPIRKNENIPTNRFDFDNVIVYFRNKNNIDVEFTYSDKVEKTKIDRINIDLKNMCANIHKFQQKIDRINILDKDSAEEFFKKLQEFFKIREK